MAKRRLVMRKLLAEKLGVDYVGKSKRELMAMLSPEQRSEFINMFRYEDKVERKEKREEVSGKASHTQTLLKIFAEAEEKANISALRGTPEPMIVREHKNTLDDNSPVEKEYFVEGGVCGFAWVHLPNARKPEAKFAKEHYRAYPHYDAGVRRTRGVAISASPKHSQDSPLIQSYEINMAWAKEFARVLNSHNIEASAGGRID